jgi:hypothetical protein
MCVVGCLVFENQLKNNQNIDVGVAVCALFVRMQCSLSHAGIYVNVFESQLESAVGFRQRFDNNWAAQNAMCLCGDTSNVQLAFSKHQPVRFGFIFQTRFVVSPTLPLHHCCSL